jgi:hypothetical protein
MLAVFTDLKGIKGGDYLGLQFIGLASLRGGNGLNWGTSLATNRIIRFVSTVMTVSLKK